MNEKKSNGSWLIWVFTLLFVAMKLMGYIDWSWIWVLSPVWIPIAIVIVAGFISGIIKDLKSNKRYNESKHWADSHENEELIHEMWTGKKEEEDYEH